MRRRLPARKLLVASIGVAAISYVACDRPQQPVSGNLVAPPAYDAQAVAEPVGNLMAPPPPEAGAVDVSPDAARAVTAAAPEAGVIHHFVGNLMPPPRRDSGL